MNKILLILAAVLSLASFAGAQGSGMLPTLRGDKAVEQLKQSGQYDSLLKAVEDARQKDGQSADSLAPEAIGQSAKLLASDGARGDNFGIFVAVSGDTALVGAYNDTVGANSNQGSAMSLNGRERRGRRERS